MIISKKNKKHFYNNFSKKNWILIFTWNNCGFCHRIKPKWKDLIKNNKNKSYKFVEIERDEIDDEFISFLNKNNKKTAIIDDYYPKLYELKNDEKKTINLINDIDELGEKLNKSEHIENENNNGGNNTIVSSKIELKKSSKSKGKKKGKKTIRKIKRKGNNIIKSFIAKNK